MRAHRRASPPSFLQTSNGIAPLDDAASTRQSIDEGHRWRSKALLVVCSKAGLSLGFGRFFFSSFFRWWW
ncbi:MAG: hypothetical protein WC483_00550 [Candidatus Paceibacterota bacterium]